MYSIGWFGVIFSHIADYSFCSCDINQCQIQVCYYTFLNVTQNMFQHFHDTSFLKPYVHLLHPNCQIHAITNCTSSIKSCTLYNKISSSTKGLSKQSMFYIIEAVKEMFHTIVFQDLVKPRNLDALLYGQTRKLITCTLCIKHDKFNMNVELWPNPKIDKFVHCASNIINIT